MFRFLSVRLEKWFSHQVMSIAGCVIIVLGVIISAFPFLPNLYIGLGVFLGTGGCLCAISGVLEINKRFTGSSRGLAHGFSLAGNTVGGLVLPALIAVMMDRYGYTGALLLLSAVILNIIFWIIIIITIIIILIAITIIITILTITITSGKNSSWLWRRRRGGSRCWKPRRGLIKVVRMMMMVVTITSFMGVLLKF